MEANTTAGDERIGLKLEAKEINIAPGESRTFSVTLTNNGESADTVDISLSGAPANWISGAARSVKLLPGGEQTYEFIFDAPADIQIGRYPFGISVTSQTDPDQFIRGRLYVDISGPETTEQSTIIDLLLASNSFTVAPAGDLTIPVVVVNEGQEDDRFGLVVEGIPHNWVSMSETMVELAPGKRKTINVTIQPSSGSRATRTKFRIVGTSYGRPDESTDVECTLTVAAYEVSGRVDVLMEALQYAVAPGAAVTIPVVLINQGLLEDTFSLLVEGLPPEWVSISSRGGLLSPGQEESIIVTIQPPKRSPSRAGRQRFKIRVTSAQDLDHSAEVGCTLVVAAYNQFKSGVQPNQISSAQAAAVVINNLGNAQASYQIQWSSEEDRLSFSTLESQAAAQPGVQPLPPRAAPYNPEIPPTIRVAAGEAASVNFTARPRQRPLVGGETLYQFKTRVESAGNEPQIHEGVVSDKAWIPVWLFVVFLIFFGVLCLAALGIGTAGLRNNEASPATQTAEYLQSLQTQLPIITMTLTLTPEDVDTDGDGLRDQFELQLGTDPLIPDSDADALTDGAEVNVHLTNPLNQDTDVDGAIDGVEVNQGTDPLNPDTDRDQLLDGQEALPCPDPLNPDSDGDSLIDGLDLDPCDLNNPSMTATAVAGQPTETPVPPTDMPPTEALPTVDLPTEAPPTEAQPTEGPPPGPPVVEGAIAFSSNRDGDFNIHVVPSEGTIVSALTTAAGTNFQPVISPNGSKIAFTSNRDGNNEIYVMNIDGSDPVNLTNNPADDQDPNWSPDGTVIVFTSNRDGNQEIYGIAGTGGDVLNLTNNPADDSQPSWFTVQGLFSSNGDWIVFTTNRDGNLEVYRMAIDGSDPLNLSNSPGNDYAPVGNPRSDRVVFTTDRDGNQEIYLMDIDGQLFANLTNNPAQDFNPTWNEGGGRIAFTTDRDGNQEIYIMIEDGSEQTNFTNNPAIDDYAAWN